MTRTTPIEVARLVREMITNNLTDRTTIMAVTGLTDRQLRRRLDGETLFAAHEFLAIVNSQHSGGQLTVHEEGTKSAAETEEPEDSVTVHHGSPPKRDQQFLFGPDEAPVTATVIRVSLRGSAKWPNGWADLRCVGPGGWQWSKRQRLPLSNAFRPVPTQS